MITTESTDHSHRNPSRHIRFFILASLLLVVWTVVLPRIAHVPAVKAHLQHLEKKGVNADAMFYTELNDRGRK